MLPGMEQPDPSQFYTGLVADLYGPLRSSPPDPEPYARFIARSGEPALELGCGDGDPMLELRARGVEVEGLDSSADMLARCRRRAGELGLEVVLHHTAIEAMELPRRYRSIFLAGPTFNLLPDDETARLALVRIHDHLAPDGTALVPLFVPEPVAPEELGLPREHRTGAGELLRVAVVEAERDERRRTQVARLRYERSAGARSSTLERSWTLHWYTQAGFRAMAEEAGLWVRAVLDAEGAPAGSDAPQFTFVLRTGD